MTTHSHEEYSAEVLAKCKQVVERIEKGEVVGPYPRPFPERFALQEPRITEDVLKIAARYRAQVATVGLKNRLVVKTLVETLDAHCRGYLRAVRSREDFDIYWRLLPTVAGDIIAKAEKNGPVAFNELQGHEHDIWRCAVLDKVEECFDARYPYWHAKGLKKVRKARHAGVTAPATVRSIEAQGTGVEVGGVASSHGTAAKVTGWDQLELVFLSDHRIQIYYGAQSETFNYEEFGFADKRVKQGSPKPKLAWLLLARMAVLKGTLRNETDAGYAWSQVEKRIQEIREKLRGRFGLESDPIPYTEGSGYRALLKMRCSPAYDT